MSYEKKIFHRQIFRNVCNLIYTTLFPRKRYTFDDDKNALRRIEMFLKEVKTTLEPGKFDKIALKRIKKNL